VHGLGVSTPQVERRRKEKSSFAPSHLGDVVKVRTSFHKRPHGRISILTFPTMPTSSFMQRLVAILHHAAPRQPSPRRAACHQCQPSESSPVYFHGASKSAKSFWKACGWSTRWLLGTPDRVVVTTMTLNQSVLA